MWTLSDTSISKCNAQEDPEPNFNWSRRRTNAARRGSVVALDGAPTMSNPDPEISKRDQIRPCSGRPRRQRATRALAR